MERLLHLSILARLLLAVPLFSTALAQQPVPSRKELEEARQWEIRTRQAALQQQRLAKAPRQSPTYNGYDVSYYGIQLTVDPGTNQITGTVTMTATALVNDLDTVELDFQDNMIIDGVGDDATGFIHTADVLQLPLTQPRQVGESFTTRVSYHGSPLAGGLGSFGFDYQNSVPMVWSLSEPYGARAWWPCKDVPSDKADSVDIILTVPDSLYAASNGALISNVLNGDGTRTFHWHEHWPITTYLVSLAITNYEIHTDWFHHTPGDSMEVKLYTYPGTLDNPEQNLTQLLDMLSYFHEIFGPYPFLNEKYGIAQFTWGGGMEHQTITSQGHFGEILTVHELAHQWWGDKITNASWHEIWLNEGFASYAEALYFEYSLGEEYFHGYMEYMDRDYAYPIYVDDTTDVYRIFNITVYDKAGWFLHMLRHVVGDSTFFNILLDYSHDPRFAYGNSTTAGFQSVCEAAYGGSLDWLFDAWIYNAGRPNYRATWSTSDSAGMTILSLQIEQTQVPARALFPMPIDLTIETTQGDTLVTVFNDQAVQDFRITLSAEPTDIILDKEGWILKYVSSSSRVDPSEIVPVAFALKQNIPNPFNTSTQIRYSIPEESTVRLVIYDLAGKEVTTLTHATLEPSHYQDTWDGRNRQGVPLPSGVYFYNIEIRSPGNGGFTVFTETRKMLLLK